MQLINLVAAHVVLVVSIATDRNEQSRPESREGLEDVVKMELTLRQAHLNDLLTSIREVIGTRNVLLTKLVRDANTVNTTTRSWAEIKEYTKRRDLLVKLYHISRRAVIELGLDKKIVNERYKIIADKHLKVSKDMSEHNRYGAKTSKIAWFWMLQPGELKQGSPAMKECEYVCNQIKAI